MRRALFLAGLGQKKIDPGNPPCERITRNQNNPVPNKKKVLLVIPPFRTQHPVDMGVAWVAANLREAAEEVRVLSFLGTSHSAASAQKVLRDQIADWRPDIIGFNVYARSYATVLELAEGVRPYHKGVIAVGGPHAAYVHRRILEECPAVDLAVVGEAERSFAEVCRREPADYHGIPGVSFRGADGVVVNPGSQSLKEFSGLRHPDYRQFGIRRFNRYPYPVSTSRGCPFGCSFCPGERLSGRGWRPRPLEEVFAELEYARRAFGIKEFAVREPTFNIDSRRVFDFCEELIRRKLGMRWSALTGLRADLIQPEMAGIMKRSGCRIAAIGAEHLAPDVFGAIGKEEGVEDIVRAVRILKEKGLAVLGSFVIGLPHDTPQKARRSFEQARKLGFDFMDFYLLNPFPGTKAYDWIGANGRLCASLEQANTPFLGPKGQVRVRVACETDDFTKEERESAFLELNLKSGNYVFLPVSRGGYLSKLKALMRLVVKYDPLNLGRHLFLSMGYFFKGPGERITREKGYFV